MISAGVRVLVFHTAGTSSHFFWFKFSLRVALYNSLFGSKFRGNPKKYSDLFYSSSTPSTWYQVLYLVSYQVLLTRNRNNFLQDSENCRNKQGIKHVRSSCFGVTVTVYNSRIHCYHEFINHQSSSDLAVLRHLFTDFFRFRLCFIVRSDLTR